MAQIRDRKLQSIAISDKSGDYVDLSANGKLTVNEKPSEFPVHEQSLYAWRTYYGVHLLSSYGVFVECTLDLRACRVHVNGFYFSKLRGLMGNGGYEQYDAQTLPNGKLADSTTQFANAYKLHKCADITIDDQHKHAVDDAHSSECDKVFGSSSSLRFCNYILDQTKYLGACQHAVKNAENKQEAACSIALGYATKCISQNIPVTLPSVCNKCKVTDDAGSVKSYELGDRYSTNTAKKADFVFVVDNAIESKLLTDTVQNFITELRHSLKKEYDAHISVIGYKKGDTYLKHYTSDGKLDITNFQLDKKPENSIHDDKPLTVGCKYLDPVLQTLYNTSVRIQDDLSLLADGRAFREALQYPFRSNAHRTIIAIRSDVLQHSTNPVCSFDISIIFAQPVLCDAIYFRLN